MLVTESSAAVFSFTLELVSVHALCLWKTKFQSCLIRFVNLIFKISQVAPCLLNEYMFVCQSEERNSGRVTSVVK